MIDGLALHPRHLSVCSGIGGIDLGLEAALGIRTVGHIERDAFAASILVERMVEQTLDFAPIWDDIKTFDGSEWSGCVDILSAGIPCQSFSHAGNRKGTDDPRWLWPDVYRISKDCRPGQIFIENTPGLVKKGLYEVLFDLAEMGYNAEWGVFNASDASAPHRRQRLFLLAHHSELDLQPWIDQSSACTELRYSAMGDSYCEYLEGDWSKHRLGSTRPKQDNELGGSGKAMAYSNHSGQFRRPSSDREEQGREKHWSFSYGRFPPARNDTEGWSRWVERGLPKPIIRGGNDGSAHRVDRLRTLGNSVVPQCVTLAYTVLLDRMSNEPQPVR